MAQQRSVRSLTRKSGPAAASRTHEGAFAERPDEWADPSHTDVVSVPCGNRARLAESAYASRSSREWQLDDPTVRMSPERARAELAAHFHSVDPEEPTVVDRHATGELLDAEETESEEFPAVDPASELARRRPGRVVFRWAAAVAALTLTGLWLLPGAVPDAVRARVQAGIEQAREAVSPRSGALPKRGAVLTTPKPAVSAVVKSHSLPSSATEGPPIQDAASIPFIRLEDLPLLPECGDSACSAADAVEPPAFDATPKTGTPRPRRAVPMQRR